MNARTKMELEHGSSRTGTLWMVLAGALGACAAEAAPEEGAGVAQELPAVPPGDDAGPRSNGADPSMPDAPAPPAAVAPAKEAERAARTQAIDCKTDARVALGLVSFDVCAGADLFFNETFGGNGRTCGSCHPSSNNYTVDPAFIAKAPADDPLFVAERDPALKQLEKSRLLREHALFVVNADGFEDPTNKFVMRSVPHMLSMATSIRALPVDEELGLGVALDGTTTPPLVRAGWSGDGAPGDGDLVDFALGAIEQHSPRSLARVRGRDFVEPTREQAAQIAKFTLGLGRVNDIDLSKVVMRDAAAERGRTSFLTGPARDCSSCHDGGGANTPFLDSDTNQPVPFNVNFEIGSELLRGAFLDAEGVPHDGGFGRRPRDSDGDGTMDVFGNGSFNTPPLIEAADTGPFFHTNAFRTLEDAIRFYTTQEFGSSSSGSVGIPEHGTTGGPFPIDDAGVAELGRFLRVLNAAFNAQMALARLDAAHTVASKYGEQQVSLQHGLLTFADEELDDALRVLSEVPDLSRDAQDKLSEARRAIERAKRCSDVQQRLHETTAAIDAARCADGLLGSGMRYEIGAATLMF